MKRPRLPILFSAVFPALPLLFLAFLSAGCLFEPGGGSDKDRDAGKTAGGGGAQDFPNTLGALAFQFLGMAGDWDQFSRIPSDIPRPEAPQPGRDTLASSGAGTVFSGAGAYFSAVDPGPAWPARSRILARSGQSQTPARTAFALAADTLYWDYSDSAKGLARRFILRDNFLYAVAETLVAKEGPEARDTVLDNEKAVSKRGILDLRILGRKYHYAYHDSDGDGVLDFRRITETYAEEPGILVFITSEEGFGADRNFDATADNPRAFHEQVRLKGRDTVFIERFTDVDGDRILWTGPYADSSLTDYLRLSTGDPFSPQVVRSRLRLRILLHKADLGKNRPLRFSFDQDFRDGGSEKLFIGGSRRDSTFHPGDTVLVRLARGYPLKDTLASFEASFQVGFRPRPWQSDEAFLARLSASCDLRHGSLESAGFALFPPPGPAAGAAGAAGLEGSRIEMKARIRPGTVREWPAGGEARLDALFRRGLEGRFTTPPGTTYRARWDEKGKLLDSAEVVGD